MFCGFPLSGSHEHGGATWYNRKEGSGCVLYGHPVTICNWREFRGMLLWRWCWSCTSSSRSGFVPFPVRILFGCVHRVLICVLLSFLLLVCIRNLSQLFYPWHLSVGEGMMLHFSYLVHSNLSQMFFYPRAKAVHFLMSNLTSSSNIM